MKNNLILKTFSLSMVTLLASCSNVVKGEATLLRSPEGKDHSYQHSEIFEAEYVAFKEKLQSFASSFSEAFASYQYKEGNNITCSPLSVELCLGLAVEASKGETREEILAAFGVDYETFHRFYKLYYNNLTLEVTNESNQLLSQILLSNSIWLNKTLSYVDSGLDALRDDYYCYSYEVDFINKNKESCKAIQEFINKQTKGLINPKINLSPETLFVLMNTLYLKDLWNEMGYDLSYVDGYSFTNQNGKTSSKKLLQNKYVIGKTLIQEDYSAFHTSTLNGIQIHFIKPNEGKNVKDVFNKANIDYVLNRQNYIYQDDEKKERYYTSCIFPEYHAETDLDISSVLKDKFNISSIFDADKCDLSNVTTSKAYCDEIRHIASLKVNKKGIEGAAVTYILLCGSSAPGEDPYKNVYEIFPVDKEFGFILTYSNTIVFSGIVTNIDK